MIRVAAILVALVLALGVAGLADGSRPRPDRGAKLTLIDAKPLTLRGTRFFPGERVRVSVAVGEKRSVQRTTASRSGAFTQRFQSLELGDRCSRLIAVAVGSRGSHATIKFFEPMCPPPMRP